MNKVPTTVAEAALLLDRVKPGWEYLINFNVLDMRFGDTCILGQVYGDVNKGVNTIWPKKLASFREDILEVGPFATGLDYAKIVPLGKGMGLGYKEAYEIPLAYLWAEEVYARIGDEEDDNKG